MVDRVSLKKERPPLGFEYRLVRSARRYTIGIEVRQTQVTVRAPSIAPEAAVLDFLYLKAAWVRRKIAEQNSVVAAHPAQEEYRQGSSVNFMGQSLQLVLGYGASAAVARVDDQLHLILSLRVRKPEQEQIRGLLTRWYEQQALQILTRKTLALAAHIGHKCNRVSIKATRSKWGHCTTRGDIQYNWQILLAPEIVVDYLVAHEVSHLRHHNHSPAFWALVASLCPDYQALRRWLKLHGSQLVI